MSKENTEKESVLGIDVSMGQTINWKEVKADGYNFAIIKSSEGYPTDDPIDAYHRDYFIRNIAAANDAGILCGAYHVLSAKNSKTGAQADNYSAETQANMLLDNVKAAGGFSKIKLPLCIDIEATKTKPYYNTMSRDEMTNIVKSFALTISKKGYVPCLYLNRDYRMTKYNMDEFGDLPMWYAYWGADETTARKECISAFFWQKGAGAVNGVKGANGSNIADLNVRWLLTYTPKTSEGAVYNYIQTKTDAKVYLDFCKKIAYVPKGYTAEQIKDSLRPLPGNEFWYSICCTAKYPSTNYIGIMDSTAMRQSFEIVRV